MISWKGIRYCTYSKQTNKQADKQRNKKKIKHVFIIELMIEGFNPGPMWNCCLLDRGPTCPVLLGGSGLSWKKEHISGMTHLQASQGCVQGSTVDTAWQCWWQAGCSSSHGFISRTIQTAQQFIYSVFLRVLHP